MAQIYCELDFVIMGLKACLPLIAWWQLGYKGLFVYILTKFLYYRVLHLWFGMAPLAALDEFFLLDNDKNRANIVTVIKTDKIPDYQSIRALVIKLAIVHPRLKHKLIKFMGEHFFKEMQGAELDSAIKKAFVHNDTIKSDGDLAAFIAKE